MVMDASKIAVLLLSPLVPRVARGGDGGSGDGGGGRGVELVVVC